MESTFGGQETIRLELQSFVAHVVRLFELSDVRNTVYCEWIVVDQDTQCEISMYGSAGGQLRSRLGRESHQ